MNFAAQPATVPAGAREVVLATGDAAPADGGLRLAARSGVLTR